MAGERHIHNPIEWGLDQLNRATHALGLAAHAVHGSEATLRAAPPAIRRIEVRDLGEVLRKGFEDFGANRTDVIFLCILYPVVGLLLSRLAFDSDMLPLIFPLASGFALLGPVAAMGLYEMSRRRELGVETSWADAFGVLRSPAFGAIVTLALGLMAIFALWLLAAATIYDLTLGPKPPASIESFLRDVLTTPAGWTLIVVGVGVGFLFAVLVLAISVVSFPMLLDGDVGLVAAVSTSVRAVAANPVPMAAWGIVVSGGLIVGSLPALLGLVVVLPVLGHATWHLYRKLVAR
jgi:uncharacterized membrane protein